ncbi:MAG: 3-hydroxyacyl-CoA dehydrogenase family protein [Xanthobacteraceae bacterium]
MQTSNRIAIIGAGFMGSVIATLYARHGYHVTLHDVQSAMLDSYRQRALPIAESLADTDHPTESILANVTPCPRLEQALDGAFLVHENVQEILTLKQDLFASLDRLCGPDVVLATNSASFLLSDICSKTDRRERAIGIHYITPAHIVRAAELIYADFTPPRLVEWGRGFLGTIDHVGIACRERPGFLINRMQFALLSEVYRIVDEGLATRDDVDAAVRLSLGPRLALWGPLLTEDLVVNKKNTLAVIENLHERTGDPNFAPRPVLRGLIEEGSVGAVSGKGWYEFAADYATVVSKRDRQLQELLAWLRAKDPLTEIGIKTEPSG